MEDLVRTATGVRLTLQAHSFAVVEATLSDGSVVEPVVERPS